MNSLTKLLAVTTLSALGSIYSVASHAEVLDSNESGFTIEFQKTINTSDNSVYTALTQHIGQWWLDDHTWFGNGNNMQLEANAGGCFCEIAGDSQVKHLEVVMVRPNQLIRLVGGLGPLQGEGVSGVMEWRMQPIDPRQTQLTVRYRVGGYTPNDLGQWAPAVENVLQQQMDAMKAFVETK